MAAASDTTTASLPAPSAAGKRAACCLLARFNRTAGRTGGKTGMSKISQFIESARSRPGLAGALFIDAVGTGMFLPFSLLFFLATTALPLTRIGLGLSIAAVARIPVTIAAGPLSDRFGPRAAIVASQLLQAAGFAGYLLVHSFWQLVAA